MDFFECCHYCVAPKRYPGCSAKCQEYADARSNYEEYKKIKHKAEIVDSWMVGKAQNIRNKKAIQNKKRGSQ